MGGSYSTGLNTELYTDILYRVLYVIICYMQYIFIYQWGSQMSDEGGEVGLAIARIK